MKVTSEFPFLAGVGVIILCLFLGFGGCCCLVSYGEKLEAEGKAAKAVHTDK